MCRLCFSHDLILSGVDGQLRTVTSDCRPCGQGVKVYVCKACGLAQKFHGAKAVHVVEQIYATYSPYQLAGGSEQKVFNARGNSLVPRSEMLVPSVLAEIGFKPRGRMLDFGCGNGAFLKVFGQHFPEWDLVGYDVSNVHQAEVESVSSNATFCFDGLGNIEGKFDFISLVHVLEHVDEPVALLKALAEKMEAGGAMLIQCPDYSANPFDLIIYDHVSHFTARSLVRLVREAGFSRVQAVGNVLGKELTVVATGYEGGMGAGAASETSPQLQGQGASQFVDNGLLFLKGLSEWATSNKGERYGIFGTSIAGVWLYSELCGGASYFVDEDPARIGKKLFGAPVLSPEDTPRGSVVLLPMRAEVSGGIARRLAGTGGADLLVYRGSSTLAVEFTPRGVG